MTTDPGYTPFIPPQMSPPKRDNQLLEKFLRLVFTIAINGLVIMFLAAVIAKRFDVWAAVGYLEAVAWAAGYSLVYGLAHKDNVE